MSSVPSSSDATLATIVRLLEKGYATPQAAITAAYRLGHIDGGLQMARISEKGVQEIRQELAERART